MKHLLTIAGLALLAVFAVMGAAPVAFQVLLVLPCIGYARRRARAAHIDR
ncbi:MAG: hypothetical protein RSH52_32165 [Janthinobacterium sp.]